MLVVIAIWAYSTGSPYNAYRATDLNKNVCGITGTDSADYPFAYFYNPTSTSLRVCVKECPIYENGNLKDVSCYNANCTYTIKIKEDGTTDSSFTAFSSTDFVGYGSYSILGRVCLPELVVLNNAFKSFSTTLSDNLKTSYLNHFVTDIQNVTFLVKFRTGIGFW